MGFDLRRDPKLEFVKGWSAERRRQHLAAPDVRQVASADAGAWPSLLPPWDQRDPCLKINEALGFQGLVNDLAWLVTSEIACAAPSAWIIAMSVREVDFMSVQDRWPADSTRPDSPGACWQLLGYDVVDGWLLSGLTNCGIGASRFPVSLMSDLNDFHLFQSVGKANELCEFLESGAHAPFMVAALWRVPRSSG